MRETTTEDAPKILEMVLNYFHENQLKTAWPLTLDIFQARHWLGLQLQNPYHIGYISDDGFVLGEFSCMWFGPNFGVNGPLLYVKPEARNGLLARRLLRAFLTEAKRRGARHFFYEEYNAAHQRPLEGLLKKEGCKVLGNVFYKEL